jgi:DoxX-like family
MTMQTATQPITVAKTALWTGRVISTLPVLMLLMSAVMKFIKPPPVVEGFAHLGLSESLALGLGILEMLCTVLYVIPRTAVLGAILLTGYLGGATVTHLRVGDPFIMPAILGVFVWGGLFLRDPRLRALIPLRREPAA